MVDSRTAPGLRARPVAVPVCWAATVLVFVLVVAMQAVKGDWLPPDISVSQYGVGSTGWVFSAFLVVLGVSTLLWWTRSPRARTSLVLLVAGALGCMVTAVVRTDPGGLQQSWTAKVHMAGSVLALVCLPLGMRILLAASRAALRRAGLLVTWGSALALILLLLAAFGLDTAGLGPQDSWAMWQAVAVVLDLALLLVVGAGLTRLRPADDRVDRSTGS
ncbi:DUF998 domain-containing protein [Nakamurella alba]|uniref:DUF998 domain-containing protein n=1 Tax=Nakamurella alba TaxID=2665158 RepID=UPI0018AC2F80|nr:DUF998 domain-containing protein [Nakamurella alba]